MIPTTARITQEFGNNFLINGQWAYPPGGHNGMDFGASYSTVVAPYSGVVDYAGWDNSGYGNLMIIRDTLGYRHWLAHLSAFSVGKGTGVGMGQAVAVSGNTGFSTAPHLHWGVQAPGYSGYNGYVNPRNWPGYSQGINMPTQAEYDKVVAEREDLRNEYKQRGYKIAMLAHLLYDGWLPDPKYDAYYRQWANERDEDKILTTIANGRPTLIGNASDLQARIDKAKNALEGR